MRQLFCGKREPHESLLIPIHNQVGFVKAGGGLWTSTYAKEYYSDWVLAYEDMWGIPSQGLDGWLLTPTPHARIYTVDSLADLHWLHERYEIQNELSSFMKRLDYEKMAVDFDGMHLTRKGQWDTRMSHPIDLYGWDCESTHWFRWCFETVEYLGKVKVANK